MPHMNLLAVYRKVDSILVKEIEDELIIISMNDGISDIDSYIYTLNTTGKEIWNVLDGNNSLEQIITILAQKYDTARERIEKDVMSVILELIKKGLLLEKKA